jgi:cell division protein FtsB
MKKVLVIIIVGLSGVIGYQMEQMDNLIQSNKALEKQNSDLQDKVIYFEDYVRDYHQIIDELNECLGV